MEAASVALASALAPERACDMDQVNYGAAFKSATTRAFWCCLALDVSILTNAPQCCAMGTTLEADQGCR
jgi:hypothetical protein